MILKINKKKLQQGNSVFEQSESEPKLRKLQVKILSNKEERKLPIVSKALFTSKHGFSFSLRVSN